MSISFTPSLAQSAPAPITSKQPLQFGNQLSSPVRNVSHEKELSDVFTQGVQHLKNASRTDNSAKFRDYSVGLKALQELIANMKKGNDSRVLAGSENEDGPEIRESGLVIAGAEDMPKPPKEEPSFWGARLEALEAERDADATKTDPIQFGQLSSEREKAIIQNLENALEAGSKSIDRRLNTGNESNAASLGQALSGIVAALEYFRL